ncbi:MAG: hypothetical protein C6I00_04475 [Nitratiruptor sp.]|nr:hypothetical protein [Nitratiruptor sp.]NPA84345.1 HDOD domain-containing protein [Campylobacterota bacterium]
MILIKHPILDRNGSIWAYELRDRKSRGTKELLYLLIQDTSFTEEVERIYLPLDRESLLDESVTILDPGRVWLGIQEEIDIEDREILERLWELREMGYHLGLEGVEASSEILPIFDLLEIAYQRDWPSQEWIRELKESGFALLARHVEEAELFAKLKGLGFDYFQGYFFAKPIETKTKQIDSAKIKIMEIYGLVESGADLEEIVRAFKEDPTLTLALLRYINSPYFGLQKEISSVRYAITFIGPQRLKRWLSLMLYATPGKEPQANPLYQLAQSRAALMSKVAQKSGLDEEKAYLTGVLSLVEILLGVPISQFIGSIKIDPEVAQALLDRESNPYGKLLMLTIAHELGNQVAITHYLKELGIDESHLAKASLEAFG